MDGGTLSLGLDDRIKKDKMIMKRILFLFAVFILLSCWQQESKRQVDVSPDNTSLQENKTDSLHSEITCPECGFKKTELLPTDVCQLKYTCQACHYVMEPKERDCCVFCSYGNIKCPSKQ